MTHNAYTFNIIVIHAIEYLVFIVHLLVYYLNKKLYLHLYVKAQVECTKCSIT